MIAFLLYEQRNNNFTFTSINELECTIRIRRVYELIGLYELLEIPWYLGQMLENGGGFSIGIFNIRLVLSRDCPNPLK